MTPTLTHERRASARGDRRRLLSRGGRRAEDQSMAELSLVIPCTACGVEWARLVSFEYQRRQSVATFVCPRCGHLERRAAVA
jgi:predicted RNA-binding Zn-ribbon protein involved in translation (DUF1610 family)